VIVTKTINKITLPAGQKVTSQGTDMPAGVNSVRIDLDMAAADLQNAATNLEFGFEWAPPGTLDADLTAWKRSILWGSVRGNPLNDPTVMPYVFSQGDQVKAVPAGYRVRGYMKSVTAIAVGATITLDIN
jgi:hypothetical protein